MVSDPATHRYLKLLETGCLITRIRPLATNPSAALVKAPKLLWADCGLAAWLAGIRTSTNLARRTDAGFWLEQTLFQTLQSWRALEPQRFLIRLIHGQTWADAARLVGYSDGLYAAQCLGKSQTLAALARAQAGDAVLHPLAVQLRRQWARAARAEVKARRAARVFIHTTAARGARRAVAVGLPLPGGAVWVRHGGARRIGRTTAARLACFLDDGGAPVFAPDRAPRVSRKVRGLAVDIGAAAAKRPMQPNKRGEFTRLLPVRPMSITLGV